MELLFTSVGVLCTLEYQMCAINDFHISVFPQLTLPHHLLRFHVTLSHHSENLSKARHLLQSHISLTFKFLGYVFVWSLRAKLH